MLGLPQSSIAISSARTPIVGLPAFQRLCTWHCACYLGRIDSLRTAREPCAHCRATTAWRAGGAAFHGAAGSSGRQLQIRKHHAQQRRKQVRLAPSPAVDSVSGPVCVTRPDVLNCMCPDSPLTRHTGWINVCAQKLPGWCAERPCPCCLRWCLQPRQQQRSSRPAASLCPRPLPSGPTLLFPLPRSWPASPLTQTRLPKFLQRTAPSERTRKAPFRQHTAPYRQSQDRKRRGPKQARAGKAAALANG